MESKSQIANAALVHQGAHDLDAIVAFIFFGWHWLWALLISSILTSGKASKSTHRRWHRDDRSLGKAR